MTTNECKGEWRNVPGIEDGDDVIIVNRCTDCGEWWILFSKQELGYATDGGTYPNTMNFEAAVREAIARRFQPVKA